MTTMSGTPIAIVLAAGKSERLGADKLFETIDGQAIVERVVNALLHATKVHDVVVVIPPGRTEDFSWLRSVKVHLVENPRPEQGMISSIRAALKTTWVAGHDFLICPADIPFVSTQIVNRVISTFMSRPGRIVIPTYKGMGGHPSLFAASLTDDFLLRGDRIGTREILIRHKEDTVRLSVHDPDVCFDVDTPEDLEIAEDPGARWARVERDLEERQRSRLR